jgi:hypothetical protein
MPSTFEKLNLKNHSTILLLNPPASFEPELAALQAVTILRTLQPLGAIDFSLAFVTTEQQVNSLAQAIASRATGDAVVWFAYPKGTSKRYKSEINRDTGWQVLGQAGFEPVRAVAIDEDWSALRFRRVEFIKSSRAPERSVDLLVAPQAREPWLLCH